MPTLDEVNSQIARLQNVADNKTYFSRKEIKYLPEVLVGGEEILALTSGFLNGQTWLVVCTNLRVLFLDKGMLGGLKSIETRLDKVNSVGHKLGAMWGGQIDIWDGSSKMEIQKMPKDSVKNFVTVLNLAIEKRKTASSGATTVVHHEAVDVAGQLQKLAALKEQGVITEAEFSAQKAKLLS